MSGHLARPLLKAEARSAIGSGPSRLDRRIDRLEARVRLLVRLLGLASGALAVLVGAEAVRWLV